MAFSGELLVSGSHDCTLRFWDLRSGTCERVVDWKAGEGHKDVVRCVVTDGRRVLSASDDKAIKVSATEKTIIIVVEYGIIITIKKV